MSDESIQRVALRPAPYPSDTRARGWRFELDYEQDNKGVKLWR